jgi:uncharacterized protein (TIRG00374 family)
MAELVLVNTVANLLAGFMPVPGGMGVAEAAYTAGLVALGVPNAAAMSTAIAFRMVTYYLPPIWGAIAMRWLRQHSYLIIGALAPLLQERRWAGSPRRDPPKPTT